MTQQISLKHGDILHAGFTGPIQELLSAATANFRIIVLNNTTLQITAGTDDLQRGIAIKGRYRFRSTETTAVIPGGLANGEHPVFVTASDNNFTGPIEEPDITVHTFGLEIKKAGETPSTAIYREVGKITVAGGVIASFRQTVGSVAGPQIEDGAMANTSVITWTRSASGGLVATITSLPKTALDADTNERLPVAGDFKAVGYSAVPAGWLRCDGSLVSRTGQAALFAKLGTNYGVGDGSTTFGLPNFIEKVPVGYGASAPFKLGESGGEKTHILGTTEVPAHIHPFSGNTGIESAQHTHRMLIANFGEWAARGNISSTVPLAFYELQTNANEQSHFHAFSGSTGNPSGGSGAAHNNMQPYQTANWLVKT